MTFAYTPTRHPLCRICTLALIAAGLAGCVEEHANRGVVYREPAPLRVVEMQDDYVYYPQYEVYYSNTRHLYGYRQGNAWAWRAEPPQVSASVIASSPAVHLAFHDSPEKHHSEVLRTYPRNWQQPDRGHIEKNDHRNDKDDDHRDHGH